jgi:hypothetical protein
MRLLLMVWSGQVVNWSRPGGTPGFVLAGRRALVARKVVKENLFSIPAGVTYIEEKLFLQENFGTKMPRPIARRRKNHRQMVLIEP